ncbi:NADH dehydrogenase [ubiquinone] 1 alpha subcomplex assembly factor 3 [Centruroides vittatus]|uniref:NADH dehydrogenase [ubiquinone] 1 alpha subcomplex assembly factor 3 n=1 Tax=Centruroides vittatus TaxID=120091 RepID=UPI00350EA2F1
MRRERNSEKIKVLKITTMINTLNRLRNALMYKNFRQFSSVYRTQFNSEFSSRLNPKNCFKPNIRFYSYEGDGKTVAIMLNKEADANLMINGYSNFGFRLNNNLFVLGPLAIFPRSVLQWNVKTVDDINENSLSLFYLLEPKIDVLVLGVGDQGNTLKPSILKFLRSKRINVEVLPTQHACTTYNYLTAENRCIAAALIPPTIIKYTDEDIVESQAKHKLLYEQDWSK